jgi:NADPH:quinone reductase-like Zn-dependent oxidoreductase
MKPAVPRSCASKTSRSASPAPGQARVRHSYVAVNFIDIYFRTGRYPLALPNGLGSDAVGVVEAVGPGVTDIRGATAWATCSGRRAPTRTCA